MVTIDDKGNKVNCWVEHRFDTTTNEVVEVKHATILAEADDEEHWLSRTIYEPMPIEESLSFGNIFIYAPEEVEKSIEKIQPITTLLSNGMSLEDIVKTTLNLFEVEVLDESNVEYKCACSHERTKKVLMTLGADDLEKLASESEVTSVNCHFCNSVYEFTSDEIKELIKK